MSVLNFYLRQGKHNLEKLDMQNLFSTAKLVKLIKYLIRMSTNKNARILYFGLEVGQLHKLFYKLINSIKVIQNLLFHK